MIFRLIMSYQNDLLINLSLIVDTELLKLDFDKDQIFENKNKVKTCCVTRGSRIHLLTLQKFYNMDKPKEMITR